MLKMAASRSNPSGIMNPLNRSGVMSYSPKIDKVVKMFPQLAGKLAVKLRDPQQEEQKGVI